MNKKNALYALLVGQIFLWTGSAYISVLYRLLEYFSPTEVTLYTEVLFYVAQAAGIAAFSLILKFKPDLAKGRSFAYVSVSLAAAFTTAALLVASGTAVLLLGILMNLCIGLLSGAYLTRLSSDTHRQCRGRVFGCSYAIGSVGTWLISLLDGGKLLTSVAAVYVFLAMAALSLVAVRWLEPIETKAERWPEPIDTKAERGQGSGAGYRAGLIMLALFVPLLCSVVNGLGNYFPVADVSKVLNMVVTRVFYAVGLLCAGIVNDKNRRIGAVCCMTALVFPFISLALGNEMELYAALCVLSYIFYGFFSVYRVVLFADIAARRASLVFLTAFGLIGGRVGDALGSLFGVLLSGEKVVLTCAAALAFVACVLVFFCLYHRLYTPLPSKGDSAEARLCAYESKHGLTSRQREIFRLVIRGCSNAEIASDLFLSESTVKFHMKNILKATSCKNRTELFADFQSGDE